MNKHEKLWFNITNDKELKQARKDDEYMTEQHFVDEAKRYISAIKERRMICLIDTVSSSGMSRTIKFLECSRSKHVKPTQYNYLNFFGFMRALGYSPVRDKHTFRIHGCGMDMIFHTNYTIIHRLYRLGFINKKQCEYLAQMTPNTI